MDSLEITPVTEPVVGTVSVPGSKSITNRALALAALAVGRTVLQNALFADDTERMMECLRGLGFEVDDDREREEIAVQGRGGTVPAASASLFVGNSGTTARFVTPLASLGSGEYTVDGVPRMRERPIGDLLSALHELGVDAVSLAGNDCPPIRVRSAGLAGGTCSVRADKSSQFLSGLLMALPCAAGDTEVRIDGPLLSAPYIAITTEMMRRFGAEVEVAEDGRIYRVPGRQRYLSPERYTVEPDASSASYFFAAAAVTGGRVRIPGIGRDPLQGDAAFVDVLERMGCRVTRGDDFTEVEGTSELRGITLDMNAISDTVMTLATIAPFADGPTAIENIGHIRHKETDRIAAVATELQRLGIRVDEREDGLTIYPAERWTPATVRTYDDHRMAMAFALVGLRVPGVRIADPGCVAKTFPDYFARLRSLTEGTSSRGGERNR